MSRTRMPVYRKPIGVPGPRGALRAHEPSPAVRRSGERLSRKKGRGRRLYLCETEFGGLRGTALPPPPKKGLKATAHKVFILDAQGGYAGEYALNEDCVVEFGEFMAQVPEGGLGDGQTVFLGEWRATTLLGDRMGLVVISSGQLGPEEVSWARAALVAAEAQLVPTEHPEDTPVVSPGPDKALMENLAAALEKREAALAEREKAAAEAERRTQASWDEYRKRFDTEVGALRANVAAAEKARDAAVRELEGEREKMRAEMDRIANAPKPVPAPQADPKLAAMQKQNEADRKYLQKYALDVLEREKKAQEIELAAEEVGEDLDEAKKEIESLRAQLVESRAAAATATPEAEAQ